jgi:hypothetical protein
MSFTSKSENLLKYFINDFDKYCVKKSARQQKTSDNIFKMILGDIRLSNTYIDLMEIKKQLKFTVKEIKTLKELPKTTLMDSTYISGTIKDKILYNILGYMKLDFKMGLTDISIYWGIFSKSDFNKLGKIKKNIIEALKIIKFCMLNKGLKIINSLDVYLYLTDKEKKVPQNAVSVLGPDNCNSAITFACSKKGKILIYRKEEWKKVLIHELFHGLCIDFATVNYDNLKTDVKKLYDVDSDFEISEAYSEYWATIINSCFISFSLLDDKYDKENFVLFVDFCIQFERIYSLFQMIKILNFMGLNYKNLYSTDELSKSYRKILYKEDTNVLCYYILKTVLLFYSDFFLSWCLINNSTILRFDKTSYNYTSFYKFIESKYKGKSFLDAIKNMEIFYTKINSPYTKSHNMPNILTNSRMTICEN